MRCAAATLLGCAQAVRRRVCRRCVAATLENSCRTPPAARSIGSRSSFAEERDRILASAKLLVNIHASEDYTVYETLRCTHVLFIGLPVVSEASQLQLGDFLEAEAEMVPYALLADAVVRAITTTNGGLAWIV